MEDWRELVKKAKEDALTLYPKLADSSPERRARQDRIDDLAFALEVDPHDTKRLAEFITLNRERAADANTFNPK
jgi:hypothetical protein